MALSEQQKQELRKKYNITSPSNTGNVDAESRIKALQSQPSIQPMAAEDRIKGLGGTPKEEPKRKTTSEIVGLNKAEQFAFGAGKEILKRPFTVASAGEKMLQGMLRTVLPKGAERAIGLPEKGTKTAGQQELEAINKRYNLESETGAEKAGAFAEQMGEFFIPGGASLKAGRVAGLASKASGAGKILSTTTKLGIAGLAEGVLGTGQSALQSGELGKRELGIGAVSLVAPAALAGLGKVGKGLIKPFMSSASKAKNAVLEAVNKALKPSVSNVKTPAMRQKFYEQAYKAFNTIKKYTPTFTDELGNIEKRNPRNLGEMFEALKQAKGQIFSRYDDIAIKSGQAGAKFSTDDIVVQLRKVSQDKSYSKQIREYATEQIEDIAELNGADLKTIQNRLQEYNNVLEGLYAGRIDRAKARVDASIANSMRNKLDEIIENTTGQNYQFYKNEYGALSAIEKNLASQLANQARRAKAGFYDITDVFTGSDILSGVITGNPFLITKGIAGRGIKGIMKRLNDPDRYIEKAFRALKDIPIEEAPSLGIPKNAIDKILNKETKLPLGLPSGEGKYPFPRVYGIRDINLPARSASTVSAQEIARIQGQQAFTKAGQGKYPFPLLPTRKGITPEGTILLPGKTPPLKSKGEILKTKLNPYKETGNLSIKTLAKLEGRETVSKQFISDLTNSGDLKQVERDLIREQLSYIKGDKINVKEFANKVKAGLLPLERVEVNASAGGRYEGISLPKDIRGNIANYSEHVYESPIKTTAGDVHFNSSISPTKNYFGHTRIEDMAPEKLNLSDVYKEGEISQKVRAKQQSTTRRVIEVQSDLYQKGGLEKELKNASAYDDLLNRGIVKKTLDQENRAQMSKLKQYNDPTAHFRMIREEVKQAALDGKKKLQFPTGETAMKIEGLGEGGGVWRFEDFKEVVPENLKIGKSIFLEGGDEALWVITDVLGDGKFRAVSKDVYDKLSATKYTKTQIRITGDLKRRLMNASEQFDISGKIDKENPIYKFYEKDVQNFLKKNFDAKTITDKQGVKWFELDIKPSMGKKPVQAFGQAKIAPVVGIGLGSAFMAAAIAKNKKANAKSGEIDLTYNNPIKNAMKATPSIFTEITPKNPKKAIITAYNPVKEQTDATPNDGSFLTKLEFGDVAIGNRKEHDPAKSSFFKEGTDTFIVVPELKDIETQYGNGVFRVRDTMNKRFDGQNKIDIFVGFDKELEQKIRNVPTGSYHYK